MNFVAQMKKASLEVTTECTLLFDASLQFDAEALLSNLSAILDIQTIKLLSEEFAGPNRYLAISAAGCEIAIEISDQIRPRAAYFEAIEWPMLHRTFEDAEAVVAGHTAHARVIVEAEFDLVAGPLGLRSTDTNFARSRLAAAVVAAFSRLTMPTAIHWKSCEMLYKPGPFLRAFETDPVSLFVRVTPFSSNREIGGVRAIGATTRGAAGLLGVETILEEAPVSVDWAMTTLHDFISQCHGRGAYHPHLSTYAPSKGDVIVVRHMNPTPEIDQKHISLEVRRVEEAGFDASAIDAGDKPAPVRQRSGWDGAERRQRPRSAKPFGRRGLS